MMSNDVATCGISMIQLYPMSDMSDGSLCQCTPLLFVEKTAPQNTFERTWGRLAQQDFGQTRVSPAVVLRAGFGLLSASNI